MAFPKFHGITLAQNSWIENLHVERLATDPTPISAGRVWINTTDKVLKFSSLDAGGAVIIAIVADQAGVSAAIAAVQAVVDAEVVARGVAVTAEATARASAIDSLTQLLSDETAARIAAVAAEATSRVAGDAAEAEARVAAAAVAASTTSDQLATEVAARLAGDVALGGRVDAVQAELNVTQAAVGLTVDGTFVAPENTTYLAGSTSLKDASVLLDTALTSEVATRVGQAASLASAVANEAQLRSDGDANLQTQLTAYIDGAVGNNQVADQAEAAARIAADSALQTELDRTQATIGVATDGSLIPITGTNYLDEVTTVFGGAFVLDTQVKAAHVAIAAETLARATADTDFNTALQAEIVTRAGNDDAQQQELNRAEAGAGLETDGSYLAPTNSNYLNSATSLKDADFVLDAAVKAVSDQVAAISDVAISELQSQLTAEAARAAAAEVAEATARAAADVIQANATAAEAARALAAEAVVQANVDAEAAARVSAVAAAALVAATAVSDEATRASGVELALQASIDEVAAAAGGGAELLKTELNAGRFTFKSVSAALTHVISHGMNSEFILPNVLVEGTDGVYRNDIVPVEEIDANSFRISLTEARRVKVSVMSMSALA